MTEPAPVVTARHVALDVLGFVARALAVALASALGLGAAVLLLAPPARAAELEYRQTLHYAVGRYSMRLPMVVGPRYIPGALKVSTPQGTGWSGDTDQGPDASPITPPVLRPGAALLLLAIAMLRRGSA